MSGKISHKYQPIDYFKCILFPFFSELQITRISHNEISSNGTWFIVSHLCGTDKNMQKYP